MVRQMNSVRLGFGYVALIMVTLSCLGSRVFGQVTTTVTPFGTMTASEGSSPTALAIGGALYGTTATGGANGKGTVFNLGLPDPVGVVSSMSIIASAGLMAPIRMLSSMTAIQVHFMAPQRVEGPLVRERYLR